MWPDETSLPGFKETTERYLSAVQSLSYEFSSLVAEAFGLPPDGLKHFYDEDRLMQHRAKIVKYPPVPVDSDSDEDQGVWTAL